MRVTFRQRKLCMPDKYDATLFCSSLMVSSLHLAQTAAVRAAAAAAVTATSGDDSLNKVTKNVALLLSINSALLV